MELVFKNVLNENLPLIGVIGGVGPYAGLDFVKKIFSNTKAVRDQDHLNCMLISCPSIIPDRTEFLFQGENGTQKNPAFGMYECARLLYAASVRCAVVVCNTAHSHSIFSLFCEMVKKNLPGLEIVNILETCSAHIKETKPNITCLGLLATKGTHKSRVYHEYFREEDGFVLLEPEITGQEKVHDVIYSQTYGIKASTEEIKPKARDLLSYEIYRLIERGAQAVILGCTELPLAVNPQDYSAPVIDPGLIAARSLIRRITPEKLTPIS